MNPKQDFLQFLAEHYLQVDELVQGRIARAHTGDRLNDKNDGSYLFNGSWGWCQNHKLNTGVVSWVYKEPRRTNPVVTTIENIFNERLLLEESNKHLRSVERAKKIMEASQPCPHDHPYLVKKGFGAEVQPLISNLRMGPWTKNGKRQKNCLLMPIHDVNMQLWSLQAINAEGDKDLLFQGKKICNFFLIGELKEPFGIVEGLATGLSVALMFKTNVAVCIDAGNLNKVACQLRATGIQKMTVYADADDAGIAGAKAVRLALNNIQIMIPSRWGSDWNDEHIAKKTSA